MAFDTAFNAPAWRVHESSDAFSSISPHSTEIGTQEPPRGCEVLIRRRGKSATELEELEMVDAFHAAELIGSRLSGTFEEDTGATFILEKWSVDPHSASQASFQNWAYRGDIRGHGRGCQDAQCLGCDDGDHDNNMSSAPGTPRSVASSAPLTTPSRANRMLSPGWDSDWRQRCLRGRLQTDGEEELASVVETWEAKQQRQEGMESPKTIRRGIHNAEDDLNTTSQAVKLSKWTYRPSLARGTVSKVAEAETTRYHHPICDEEETCIGWSTESDARKLTFKSKSGRHTVGCGFWVHALDLPDEASPITWKDVFTASLQQSGTTVRGS